MKPLYLVASRSMRVVLDGPALCVSSENRADSLYPLARLTSVVVYGLVEWHTEALLACLSKGIPITFLDHTGKPAGFCFGTHRRERSLSCYLIEFLELADWREHYAVWFAAEQRRAILRTAGELKLQFDDWRPKSAWSYIMNYQKQCFRKVRLPPYYQELRGMLTAHTMTVLSREGYDARLLHWKRKGFNLALDIARLQEWGLTILVQQVLASSKCPDAINRLEWIAAFEIYCEQYERRLHALLQSLEKWLRELLS